MANINGWWFLIIGSIVVIVSKFFTENLEFFVYVGIAFIVYGVIKIGLSYFTKPKTRKYTKSKEHLEKKEHKNSHHKQHHQNHSQPNQQNIHMQQKQKIFYCRTCGKPLTIQDNFCSHCGMKQR